MNNSSIKRERMTGEQRRAFILEKAKQVFARHSYRDASTSQLAHESEVSEPMLYRHFSSKKDLFLSVLEEFGNRFTRIWQNKATESAQQKPLQALAEIGLDYREAIKSDPDILKVFFQAIAEAGDPEILQVAQRNNQNARAFIYDLLKQAQAAGQLPESLNLDAATWGYLSMGFAMQISLMLQLDDELDEATLREINRLWLRALQN